MLTNVRNGKSLTFYNRKEISDISGLQDNFSGTTGAIISDVSSHTATISNGYNAELNTYLSRLNERKRTIITRAEQSYGRVPLAGLCRLFISVYAPGAGLPGGRASAFPAPHGSEICPDRAAYSAPAIDTHKAQCRWPWPFPPANTQWHWIPLP